MAMKPADRGLAMKPADRGLAMKPADRGLALKPADRGLAMKPADRGLAMKPADRALAMKPADRALAMKPADRCLAMKPADRCLAMKPADRDLDLARKPVMGVAIRVHRGGIQGPSWWYPSNQASGSQGNQAQGFIPYGIPGYMLFPGPPLQGSHFNQWGQPTAEQTPGWVSGSG